MFKEALDITNHLGQINSHHETPAEVLGIPGNPKVEQTRMASLIEHRHLAELSDHSHLYQLDTAVYALIREGLPPGSIIETGIMSPPPVTSERVEAFLSFDTVAIVLRHTADETQMLGLRRSPRRAELQRGMQQGAWGTYLVDTQTYSEKDDAKMALQRLFSTTQGIEGTQMLSSLFNSFMLQSGGNMQRISEAGCFSHEQPLKAIPLNLLLGNTQPIPTLLRGTDTNRIVRIRLSSNLNQIQPLAVPRERINEDHLVTMGLIQRAEHIAATNPLQVGAGTASGKVLDAMLETTMQLPELVGNNANNRQATNIFRQKLGLR